MRERAHNDRRDDQRTDRSAIRPRHRRACGYRLANDGVDTRALQAYLGYRNIQNTRPTPR